MTEVRARTISGFCRAYGIGRTMTYELIRAGRLRTVKAGVRTLVDEDSARVWFASLAPENRAVSGPQIGPQIGPQNKHGLRRKTADSGEHSGRDNRSKSGQ